MMMEKNLEIASTVWVHWGRLEGGTGAEGADTLSDEERERAGQFKFARDRRRYLECRLRLREILAIYVGTSPGALDIVLSPEGKPHLPGGSWHFNLSHSGDFYAVAICRDAAVGIDVETGEGRGELLDLVSAVCHREEAGILRAASAGETQRMLFLAYWAAKEAFLKGLGCGLQMAPERVHVLEAPVVGGMSRVEAPEAREGEDARWRVHFLHLSSQLVLAVAADEGQRVVVRESPFDA